MALSIRWTLSLLLMISSLCAGLWIGLTIGRESGVHAHEWNGAHWPSTPVGYSDITDNYSANVISRRNDFNAAVSNVQIEDRGHGGQVQIGDADYGKTNWAGVCRPRSPRWTRWYFIDLNEHFMERYVGNKRSAVIAHEMGHCFGGLTHHDSSGVIMQSTVNDFYDRDNVWGIDPVTAREIDALWR